jgi:hypothetical protein
MANKITIAQLDIDTEALIKSASETKKQIQDLAKTQSDLKKSGEETSEEFIKNEAQLKSLQGAYREQQSVVQQLVTVNGQLMTSTQALEVAMDKEAKTIAEASANNKELIKLRNQVDASTEDGAKTIAMLNGKIDENTEFIRNNGSAMEQQRMNIGNYGDAIRGAVANLNPMNGGLDGFIGRSKEAGGVGNLLGQSFKALTQGIIGFTKASLAFIMTPVGAVITAIVLAITILYNIFKGFTPIVDKIEQGFAALSAVLNVVKNAVIALVTGAKSLGDVFSNLGGSMRDAAQAAAELKKAQQDLEDALAEQEVQTAKNKNAINQLMIQSRDRTKTEAERIALLEKAGKLEEQDFAQRKKNADENLRQAQEEIRIKAELTDAEFKALQQQGLKFKEYTEKKTTDNDEMYDKLKEALLKQTDLEGETIATQEKLIVRRNMLLEKEEQAKEKAVEEQKKREADAQAQREKQAQERQKALDDIANKLKAELDLYVSLQGEKAKTMQGELDMAQQVATKKLAIAQAEYNASEKTEADKLALQTAQNDVKQELLNNQLETAKVFAQADFDLFMATNASKLEGVKILTQDIVNEEAVRLEKIQAEKQKLIELELGTNQAIIDAKIANNEELTVNDKAYLTQKTVLEDETNRTIQANKDAYELQVKEQKASQLIADNEIALANAQSQWELEQLQIDQQYEAELAKLQEQLQKQQITKEQYNKLDLIATEKKNQMKQQSNVKQAQGELKAMQDIGNGLLELFGKNKAIASAMALINGSLAVMEIWKTPSVLLEPAASIAKGIQTGIVVATTAKNVAQINGAKLEDGGIVPIGGKRHAQGGTKFWGEDGTTFEAEAGEGIGVLNRSAFRAFMDFNNMNGTGVRSTPSFMAGGGIITRGISAPTLNEEMIVRNTVEAFKNLPPQVVSVEDINYKFQEVAQVEVMSNF